jgi:uncharacterized damage-inducible protein DinB
MKTVSRFRVLACLLTTVCLLGLVAAPALAEHHEKGYLADFGKDFEGASKKLNDLADAIPADKYGWGPTDEVRTVSESIIHVATANFFLAQALGVPAPEGIGPDAEKTVTAKADVIAMLKKSQEHVRQAIEKAGDDLDTELELFGGKRSKRGVFMIIAGHSHEHLGQLIAYGRSVGVVPPWSRPASDS